MYGWTSTIGAQLAVVLPLLAPSAPPPPEEPLVAEVVDVAPYPTVLVDVVIPWQFATADIEPSMLELEDATIESVAPVDPNLSVVSLVIDDGPRVPTRVVYQAQAASLDLIRTLGNETAIALSTPSGMQTRPQTHSGANISRVAGIAAGAPDIVPLHRLVVDAARRLAGYAWPDRHLVLVIGQPINEAPTLRALEQIAAESDVRLHVIAHPSIETGEAARLALKTGGVASSGGEMQAEIDNVTDAIAHRVRVTATVDGPGRRQLALTLDGTRFRADVDVVAPPSATSATAATSPATTPGTVAGGAVPPATADVPVTGAPITEPISSGASVSGSDRTTPLLIGAGLAVAAIITGWLWVRARRRAAREPEIPTRRARPATREVATVGAPAPASARQSSQPQPARAADAGEAGDPLLTGAPAVERPRPAGRPRRETPRRRPTTDVPPSPDVRPLPKQEEPDEVDEWLAVDRLRLNRRTREVFAGPRRISLTPGEVAVLELLMTDGGHGVTRDAILAAAAPASNGEETPDPDSVLAELRRKTGIRGRGRGVRSERAYVYFFGE
jgi:hypothetical protein